MIKLQLSGRFLFGSCSVFFLKSSIFSAAQNHEIYEHGRGRRLPPPPKRFPSWLNQPGPGVNQQTNVVSSRGSDPLWPSGWNMRVGSHWSALTGAGHTYPIFPSTAICLYCRVIIRQDAGSIDTWLLQSCSIYDMCIVWGSICCLGQQRAHSFSKLREWLTKKKLLFFWILSKWGEGGVPCPNFLAPFHNCNFGQ